MFYPNKQRMRQGADNLEFSALIEGVSTLEEPDPHITDRAAPYVSGLATVLDRPAPPEIKLPEPEGLANEPVVAPVHTRPRSTKPFPSISSIIEEQPAASSEARLARAIREMIVRLHKEMAQFATLLMVHAIEPAGASLAEINRTLELLNSIDPRGDQARKLKDPGAPPLGRTWPAPTWSVVEFTESPLSGLLPPHAEENRVRRLPYSPWASLSQQPPYHSSRRR